VSYDVGASGDFLASKRARGPGTISPAAAAQINFGDLTQVPAGYRPLRGPQTFSKNARFYTSDVLIQQKKKSTKPPYFFKFFTPLAKLRSSASAPAIIAE
jgi:hypothetical protein